MKQETMTMEKGQVLSLQAAADCGSISCSAGVIWLTRENDSEDHILTPGEAFSLSGRGLCVIEAVTDCTICLTPAFPAKCLDKPGEVSM